VPRQPAELADLHRRYLPWALPSCEHGQRRGRTRPRPTGTRPHADLAPAVGQRLRAITAWVTRSSMEETGDSTPTQ
jgi:hypothetical protein